MAPREKRFGFPSSVRLRRRREFLGVFQDGTRRFSAHFIFFLKRSDLPHPRLGVTVSKKVGNAAVRNRVKRLVREAFRLNGELFHRPVDLVVVAKRRCEVSGLDDVVKELRYVLRRYYRDDGAARRPRDHSPGAPGPR